MLRFFILIITFCDVSSQWQVSVEYSTIDNGTFEPLGVLTIEKIFDGNYTGTFKSSVSGNSLSKKLKIAAEEKALYRVRSTGLSGYIQGYNEPCLMLWSDLFHEFRVSVSSEHQLLQSMAVFPGGLHVAGSNYHNCNTKALNIPSRVEGHVIVNQPGELPTPDTLSYIKKMEKEKQARQHGAQEDNRSFIQKYWMYIAAAVVFMVISNAAAGDQGGE